MSYIPEGKCAVCASPATIVEQSAFNHVDCLRCGQFSITSLGYATLEDFTENERTLLSGYLLENQNTKLTQLELSSLEKSLRLPPVGVRAEKLFLFLARRNAQIGADLGILNYAFETERNIMAEAAHEHHGKPAFIRETVRFHLQLLAVSRSAQKSEVLYLLDEILVKELRLLTPRSFSYEISPRGWEHLAAIQRNPLSTFGFVAMSFKDELLPAYDNGIEPGIRAAGYNPLRIDRVEHVNRIDDEIIASIRRARFCVADLTLQNDGAYFEAGYALGFGIPVIWTCKKGEKTHFDARQFNTIFWEDGVELAKRVQFRIERVVGRGPN